MAVTMDVECLEQSKDPRLRRFLAAAVELLDTGGLCYAAFGSCAVFAHGGRIRRLPRDLDIVLSQPDFERLEQVAIEQGFEAEREAADFVRVRHDIFQLHAVPEKYQLFDYRTRGWIADVDTVIPWAAVERLELRFATGLEPLALRVVPAETLLMTCLLRPLNTHSVDDLLSVLRSGVESFAGVRDFALRNLSLCPMLGAQLSRLKALVSGEAGSVIPAIDQARAILEHVDRSDGCLV